MSHGTFSGEPRTEWLTEGGDDRRMQILVDFNFVDPKNTTWDAPIGWKIDGASIPRALWTLAGSPYTGDYRRASIVHDVACDRAGGDKKKRRAADKMFYHGCRAGGCSVRQSILLYIGVRIGSIARFVPQWALAIREESTGPRLERSAAEEQMEADYQRAGEAVLARGEIDDIEEIERRVDEALTTVTAVDVSNL